MTYALRHHWWVVLSGVGIASFLVHGPSVTIGHFVGLTLPEKPIAFAAAIAFLLFAVWTWRDSRKGDEDDEVTVAEPRYVIFAVVSSFVLAELGDKTMLVTVALASDNTWAGVWIGATAGMVLADGVAIVVGRLLYRRLPERFRHVMASVLFLLFGLWLLFDKALGGDGWPSGPRLLPSSRRSSRLSEAVVSTVTRHNQWNRRQTPRSAKPATGARLIDLSVPRVRAARPRAVTCRPQLGPPRYSSLFGQTSNRVAPAPCPIAGSER